MESTEIPLKFYEYFNELNSSEDTSYFADAYRAIEPLNDEEVKALKKFQQKLSNYNSSKVFDYISNALWKNVPFVYVPKDEIHLDLIEELMKDDFDITIALNGVYLIFTNRSDQDYNKGRSRIVNMLDRAFTTRSMLSGIFQKIIDSIVRRMGLLRYDKLVFNITSYYVNSVTISNIVSEVTSLHSYVSNETVVVIDIDKDPSELDDIYPALFSSIEHYSMLTDVIYSDIMLAATERRKHKMIKLKNPYIRNVMFYELQKNGFHCKKFFGDAILVDWSNADTELWSFAHKCWIRYNTVSYYRVCVSAVTRSLHKDPKPMAIMLPVPKNPIDENFFIEYFNKFQSHRCFPIKRVQEHTYTVAFKPEYREKS